ncbi:GDSL esterase/lipase EXL1-like [Salvia miltiorrhiza]|uniref:GDSL esterase/lipase EXL1-like n=1 Tax=Salvia miltiorrhiza TaxID=226208 RepID=UPI0025AC884C|nr:GDSL esterase/lipase EXL1-like [Salvia miltiorrhiza]
MKQVINCYICGVCFVMLFVSCKGVIKLPENMTIPAVYAFGDSIVDQGNNNLIKTLIYCNFLPYGQDFPGGFPSGRFTNGKTPPDLIAEELGIKDLIPAYSDKNLTAQDLPTGVSFASGGCGYDPQTSKIVAVTSLSDQLGHFKEYIGKLKGAVGEEGTNKILKEGLFLVVAGSDDLANTYFTVGIRRMQYDISSYADLLVASASDFIQEIYKLGARRIAVFSIPPIGCLPSQRTLAGGSKRDCADNYNKAAQLVNSKLSLQLLNLNNTTLPQSRVVYIDVYNPLLDLILHPQNYGFEVSDKGCCGSGNIEVTTLCNKYSGTCGNVSNYIFWDSYHPTEGAYKVLVDHIIHKYIESFVNLFKPLLFLCLATFLVAHNAAINLHKNTTIPAFIVFGDSVVDTGNNNYLKTIIKVNYPPYGQDFVGGRPTGRFSDGKVPSDLIAEELGIKELLPAYLDPNLQDDDLLTGVNFASGGSGFDPLTSNVVSVLSLWDQLEMFKDYIRKVEEMVGQERTSALLSKSLFAVVSGSNDVTNTYFGAVSLRKSQYDVPAYADLLVSYASALVQDLYKLGARRMGVFGLAPLGCLPSQRSLKGGAERKCVDLYNDFAEMFNQKLFVELRSLNARYPEATLIYVDIYNLPLDLIRYPQKYGFKVSDKGCCGTGTIEVAFLCKYTCWNASDYVFWDSFHLTEKAYRLLVHQILTTTIHNFLS